MRPLTLWSRLLAGLALSSAALLPAQAAVLKVVGWNDLGMHCMDSDYSVFSILPPFNTLHAQVIDTTNNKLVTSGVTVSFEALADLGGSRNTYSVGKTNFWDFAKPLYGADLPPGIGLTGLGTAGVTPQAMSWQATPAMWEAVGIPITPVDDTFKKNTYPMTKVVVRDSTGTEVAHARVVLPVSDEMTCVACHASGSQDAAKPARGWVYDPRGPEKDYRRNILARHDDQHLGTAKYKKALLAAGYSKKGLLDSADGGHPILCAACHASNALPGTGQVGISAMTSATHTLHASVINPNTGLKLGDDKDRGACYMCHPGAETKCLRGVMGNATGPDGLPSIQCQSCHSTMAKVGSPKRVGWLQQPTCQACHYDGKRDLMAVNAKGQVKTPADTRFATNANVPAPGFNLYRFSKGHGGLQCEACHGSTHAEYTSSHDGDNQVSVDTQGHVGTLSECSACHSNLRTTANGGPHGLHTIGQAWVGGHGNAAERDRQACAYCHGADFRGSPLAKTAAVRDFNADGKKKHYEAGTQVTCYDCHNGPGGNLARKAQRAEATRLVTAAH
ncbi:multiheme c-type cytochrome [Ideonella alba]|uniref:Cytochrome c-552/4 domain-containing protein n=1 Tax=Ideonella alba TaxID=2824118 RepID=A0A940YBX3_9BURK|nr:hypothetical protein [Ideonella alba]MBQ0929862.1 hypothetical protein [Ideonella alba]